jgi:aspartyl-tRNA(Asn)/glutamyl-tRNA(Gln) amidotransferase subunit C
MHIKQDTLSKLEKLSMLEIDKNKTQDMKKSLEEIIGFMDNLSSIPTDEVKETMYFHSPETPLREDKICKSDVSDDVLANAPHSENSMFIVPKIIE